MQRATRFGFRQIVLYALAALGLLLAAAAAVQTLSLYSYRLLWTRLDATLTGARMTQEHDGEALLVFGLEAALAPSDVPGLSLAKSAYASRDFAWVRKRLLDVRQQKRVTVFYNPSKPSEAVFDSHVSPQILAAPIRFAVAGAALLLVSWLVSVLWSPDRSCRACGTSLKAFYRFCSRCGESQEPRAPSIPT